MSLKTCIEKKDKIFADRSLFAERDAQIFFFKTLAPILHQNSKKLSILKKDYEDLKKEPIPSHILKEFEKFNLLEVHYIPAFLIFKKDLLSVLKKLNTKICLLTAKPYISSLPSFIEVVLIKNGKIEPKVKKVFNIPKFPHKNDRKIPPSYTPSITDKIKDNEGHFHRLIKQIGRTGGEGSVYLTDSNLVCKIYKPEKTTIFRYHKIKLLIDNKIEVKNVSLPKFLAKNQKDEFVGYLMPPAKGYELKTSIFIPPLLKQKFPHWKRRNLVKVSLNIAKTVKKLHSYNIILGDINPSNILVENENEIYFIDTDSYQIEGYPCPVGMIPYTRVKHHNKRYDSFLRSKEDDLFALSTLIFQILMPGKLPYSYRGGKTEKENMNPANFPYNCYDSEGYHNTPIGQWSYIWSNFPRKLKEMFCQIFKKEMIVPIDTIIYNLNSYLYQIEKGWQSDEIFPSSYKKIDKKKRVILDEVSQTRICKECGAMFDITVKEEMFLKQRGWKLPTRCKVCRKNKKFKKYY